MKIINSDCVYVQKNDIAILPSLSSVEIPASIFVKAFDNGLVVIDDSNKFEFVKFEKEDEIEFFKSMDWILDYNIVKNLSKKAINAMCEKLAEERNNIVKFFCSMSNDEQKRNKYMVDRCMLLNYMINTLMNFTAIEKSEKSLTLPEGTDYPDGYVKNKETTKENRIKRLLKRFKK